MSENIRTLKTKKLFLLDMDGTLYLDDALLDGAAEFVECVRRQGQPVFLTNNSSRGIESYIEKMDGLGIEAYPEDFVTSVDAVIYHLKNIYSESDGKLIYIVGTESFKSQMRNEGFSLVDEELYRQENLMPEDIDIVLLGFDRELSYQKLEDVSEILTLNPDCAYIATNPDMVCPTGFGYVPDCGSIAEMIEHAVRRMPKFIGKPEPLMAELAMKRFGCEAEDTVIIGDRLYTDIACGEKAGIDTCFVLSGEGTADDIDKYGITPTFIFNGVGEILKLLLSRGDSI